MNYKKWIENAVKVGLIAGSIAQWGVNYVLYDNLAYHRQLITEASRNFSRYVAFQGDVDDVILDRIEDVERRGQRNRSK